MSDEMREGMRTASPDAAANARGDAGPASSGAAADGGAWRAEDDPRVAALDAKIAEVKRAHRARLKRLNAERDALVKAVEGEHMRAELERLRAENASLRARCVRPGAAGQQEPSGDGGRGRAQGHASGRAGGRRSRWGR